MSPWRLPYDAPRRSPPAGPRAAVPARRRSQPISWASSPGRGSGDAARCARPRTPRSARRRGSRGRAPRARSGRGGAALRLPSSGVVRRVAGPEGRGDDLDLELLRHGLLPAAQFGVVEGRLLLGGGVAHVLAGQQGQDAAMTGPVVAFAESSKSKTHEFGVALGQPQRARAAQNTDTAPHVRNPHGLSRAPSSRLLLVYEGVPSEV